MFGKLLATGYFSTVVTVLVLRHVFKASGMTALLFGVRSYFITGPAGQTNPAEEPKSKKAKKLAKFHQQQQVQFQGSPSNVTVQVMGVKSLQTLSFAEDVETLVTSAASLFFISLVLALTTLAFGLPESSYATILSGVVIFYALVIVLRVELNTGGGPNEHAGLLFYFMAGLLISWFFLSDLVPKHMLDFNMDKCITGFDKILNSVFVKAYKRLGWEPGMHKTDSVMMGLGLSVLAGLIAAVMKAPASKYAKLLFQATHIPAWGQKYISYQWLHIKAMQLGFVAPLLVVLLQIKPLVAPLGLPEDKMLYISAGLLLLVGVTHFRAHFSMCQAWLDVGLRTWYKMLHSGITSPNKLTVVNTNLEVVRILLGTTACQLFGMVVLTVALAVMAVLHPGQLLLLSQYTAPIREQHITPFLAQYKAKVSSALPFSLTGSTDASVAAQDAVVDDAGALLEAAAAGSAAIANATTVSSSSLTEDLVISGQFYSFVATYFGWWLCLVWCVYAFCHMTVLKLGLNIG